MATRRNAKFVLDILASRISLLILGAITVWLGISVARELYRKHQVNKEIAYLRQEIRDLEKNNDDLASLLDSFKNPSIVELEAKRRLNLKKSGEEVAVILRSPEAYSLTRDKSDESKNVVRDNGASDQYIKDEFTIGGSKILANPLKWWLYITSK